MALRKKLKIRIFITGFYAMQSQPSPSCTTVKSGAIDTPNVLRYCKVCLSLRVFDF